MKPSRNERSITVKAWSGPYIYENERVRIVEIECTSQKNLPVTSGQPEKMHCCWNIVRGLSRDGEQTESNE
jgi:hypothetical protein